MRVTVNNPDLEVGACKSSIHSNTFHPHDVRNALRETCHMVETNSVELAKLWQLSYQDLDYTLSGCTETLVSRICSTH